MAESSFRKKASISPQPEIPYSTHLGGNTRGFRWIPDDSRDSLLTEASPTFGHNNRPRRMAQTMSHVEQNLPACREYRADQECVNVATHGVGFLLSVGATIYVAGMVQSIELGLAVCCLVYTSTLVSVYAISTISHAIQRPRAKFLLRAWDQGVIYLLIAGTYSPFVWSGLEGTLRLVVLSLLWGSALTGFISKVVRHHRVNDFSAAGYLMLGWIPAMVLFSTVSYECLMWMVAGGVSYTVGTLFLTFDHRVRYFHAVWHLWVIGASACHYYAIVVLIMLPSAT